MTLDDYIAAGRDTLSGIARKANTSGASITRIKQGTQQPSADMIRAIVAATGGEVTANDLLGITAPIATAPSEAA